MVQSMISYCSVRFKSDLTQSVYTSSYILYIHLSFVYISYYRLYLHFIVRDSVAVTHLLGRIIPPKGAFLTVSRKEETVISQAYYY